MRKIGGSSQTWNVEQIEPAQQSSNTNSNAAGQPKQGRLSPLPNPNAPENNIVTSRGKKFRLLLWKNWTIQKRHPWHIVFEIVFPIFCSFILIVTRNYVPANFLNEPTEYHNFFVDTAPFEAVQELCNEIYYTPSNPATDALMNTIRDKFFQFATNKYTITGFKSEDELVEAYKQTSLHLHENNLLGNSSKSDEPAHPVLAGVVFTNSFEDGGDEFPSEIQYTLRFPAKQRSEFDLISERFGLKAAWYTDILYPFLKLPGPRAPFSANGGLPGYYAEGFLYLQYAIDTTLTRKVLNETDDLKTYENYEVSLRRFPYPPYIEDKFVFALQGALPLLIMVSFIYPVLNITRCITLEKEKRLKESMKMMGLPNYLHWAAWIVRSFAFLTLSVILMTILLKVRFTGQGVMEFSNPIVLFFIIFAFSVQAVAVAFFVSSLSNTANAGAIIAAVLWFIFFVPYMFLEPKYYLISRTAKIGASFLTNSPIALICFILCALEARGEGVEWDNMFTGIGPGDDFCVADCLIMIAVNSVIYFFITLYIESVWPGEYGIPLPWYYPFMKSYWVGGMVDQSRDHTITKNPTPPDMLDNEPNGFAGVKIKGLSKTFGPKKAVRNLHLNMYENQITALLGHNGAGKSTTISMLTGLYPPTSGTAFLNGFDIETELKHVRTSLGICPQHDVLFDDLTVEEHLRFFCLLKGFPEKLVPLETDRILQSLGLEDKRKAQAHTLSGGMKRKLSVSIAFCANSKVVLLDEPTSGMDPSARRSCWDLIQNFKKGRTVLLSTHFMEEADLLGDRIAIMADGELQCCGSSLFLKKKYGGGYHLKIVKENDCDPEQITALLRKRIPQIAIDQNIGAELCYSLPDEKSILFPQMFEELEARKIELGIASYGASITTMEEVFIRVGREAERKVTEEFEKKHGAGSSVHGSNSHIGVSLNSLQDSKINLYEQSKRNTGLILFLQQFWAMVVKKLIYVKRNRMLLFGQMGLPVLVILVLLIIAPSFPALSDAPPLTMGLQAYQQFGEIFTTVHCGDSSPVCEAFKDIVQGQDSLLQDTKNQTLLSFIVEKQKENLEHVNYRYIVGFEEAPSTESSGTSLVGFFNNEELHTPPLVYNLLTNAILKSLEKNLTIKVTNSPFPYTRLEIGAQSGDAYTLGFLVGHTLCFGMSFLSASYVVFLISERESRAKHIQYISGVKFYTFWFANYVVDCVLFMIPCLLIQGLLHLFKVEEYTSPEMSFYMFLFFIVFDVCILPFMYLLSFGFTEAANGFIRTAMFNVFSGMIPMIIYSIITIADFKLEKVGDTLNDVLMVFPMYAFGNGMVQMAKNVLLKDQCSFFFDSPESLEFTCLSFENNICCTTVKENFFEWEVNGIGKNLCSLLVLGAASIIILLGCELRFWEVFQRKSKQTQKEQPKNELDELIVEDEDVAEERKRITKTPLKQLFDTDNLILRDLTKKYGNFLAVDKLNLGVQRGQTFGLLGINGAGKTTTFKMLTGDYPSTGGDAFIYSHSIRNDIEGVHRNMGYCPQFDALIDQMTGRETLRMIGRLRGIYESDIDNMINKIAENLIFTEYLDRIVKNYSGGNKRKLSTAMALVGNPPFVFLDEPTTGMDPVARRHLWNAITMVRDSGTSIVLTSHSLEECEVLCSRLAIMVNGVFRCLGSPQHLKNKFGEGYTIIAQCPPVGVGADYTRDKQETALRRNSSVLLRKALEPQKWEQALDGLRNFIEDAFPNGSLKDIHPGFLHYHVPPAENITWGKLFETMEVAKEQFKLDAYSVGQTSLEQVFLNFAKSQVNID